jgi:hypothetical protein
LSKENEPEVKLDLEDDSADLPELQQECVVPVLDKNEAVVSIDVKFLDKFCLVSCM